MLHLHFRVKMNRTPFLHFYKTRSDKCLTPLNSRLFCKRHETTEEISTLENSPESDNKNLADEISAQDKKSHKAKLARFFKKSPHLTAVKSAIPEKYLSLSRRSVLDNLYLIDSDVAQKAVEHVVPEIEKNPDQIICDTNAGLGLVASELLNKGVKLVRLYESCPEFKEYLKAKFKKYEGHVELFSKDLFLLHRFAFVDKQDNGTRVQQLLEGVSKKSWHDDPVMTIIGPLPSKKFIWYLMRSLVFQAYITSLGRVQLFTFMKPRDFIILTAGPHLNLHTYRRLSVIFDLFFEYELLEKFPRRAFLPWQSKKGSQTGRYPGKIDTDCMYFVKINFKRELPVEVDNLLPLYSFVDHFFGTGSNRVVPELEKWFPGCGFNVIVPQLKHKDYFKNLNIFTQFGELSPRQVLAVFKKVINYPEYEKSHFMHMIESRLVTTETIETALNDYISEKNAASSDADSRL